MTPRPRPLPEILDATPPHDLAAERGVLCSILIDPEAMAGLAGTLSPGDFHAEAYRQIYAEMLALHNRGDAPDLTLLLDRLRGVTPPADTTWESVLGDVVRAEPTAANAPAYAAIVRRHAVARVGRHAATDALRRLTIGDDPVDVLGELCERVDVVAPPAKPEAEPARVQPWTPFPTGELPAIVRDFVSQTAAALGCDESFVALPVLAVLAASIGTTRRILLKASWAEPCILWTAVVAESGSLKSPAVDAAKEPLEREQDAALDEYETQIAEHAKAVIFHEAGMRKWKNAANKSSGPGDPPEPPAEPKPRRCVVSDTTIECLAERLHANPRGVLASFDELGAFFGGFSRYKKGGSSDESHWLALYGARTLTVDRKANGQQPIRVRHAGVSICGAIPPATLARALGEEFFENGLAARFLLTSPPPRKKQWHNRVPPAATLRAWDILVRELLLLDFADDKDGRAAPVDVPLSPEAAIAWQEWYDAHAAKLYGARGDMAAMLSKNEGMAARLALIVHLARTTVGDAAPEAVDAASMRAGCNLADWFGAESERVYGVLRPKAGAGGDERRELIAWIVSRGGRTTARELHRENKKKYPTTEAAELALDELVQGNVGAWHAAPAGPAGGRPSRVFGLVTIPLGTKPPQMAVSEGFVTGGIVTAPKTQNAEPDAGGYLEL